MNLSSLRAMFRPAPTSSPDDERLSATLQKLKRERELHAKEHDALGIATAKLKRERELHAKDRATFEAATAKLKELERRYRALIERGATAGGATRGADAIERVRRIAEGALDDDATRARIDAYHADLGKTSYARVWRERMDLILSVIDAGETNLMRALSLVRSREESRRDMTIDPRRWVIADRWVDLPWRPAAAAYRSAVFESVLAAVRPDTTKIIETGSGWGEHLCNVYLNGGPIDATYYACEIEEEGRLCALMLASLDPLLRLEARFFDYLAPSWADVPADEGHTILLTAHSIEQVATIHEDCIRGALALGSHVSGIHFEPIGWQTQPEDARSEVSRAHHARCTELHYNENLWPLLRKLEAEGLLRITRCETNLIGLDYNPATYITWEKAETGR